MFLGTYLVSVTSGKRISIPSIFRQNLGKELILSQWYEECLVLVSKSSLNTLLSRVTGGKGSIIEPIRKTEHFIFASSYEVEPDEQGRIVIPDRLVAYAKLKEQIYFLGVGDRVEIWNKETWEEREKEVAQDAASYIEELAKRNDK
jgi:MraZ protein